MGSSLKFLADNAALSLLSTSGCTPLGKFTRWGSAPALTASRFPTTNQLQSLDQNWLVRNLVLLGYRGHCHGRAPFHGLHHGRVGLQTVRGVSANKTLVSDPSSHSACNSLRALLMVVTEKVCGVSSLNVDYQLGCQVALAKLYAVSKDVNDVNSIWIFLEMGYADDCPNDHEVQLKTVVVLRRLDE